MDFLGRASTFVRIVEAGSFSAAARSLGLSLAAVSRQISSLEDELGAPLFERTTRTPQLTDAGRRFYEHASRLVRDAEAARASVRPDRAVGGRVVLSASVTLGVLRIVPAIPALLEAYPALDLSLRLEDRAIDVVSEGVDVGVRAGMAPPDTASLVAQKIATFRRVVVASPAYLKRAGTPREPQALSAHAAVVGPEAEEVWRFVEEGEEHAVTVQPKLRVGTLLGIRAAALAGLGVAALPDFVVASDLREGSMREILAEAELPPVIVYALFRVAARNVPRVRAVVEHLKATVPLEGIAR
jgi:DNA-binding transcriptional LysR family regulator